MTPIHHRWQKQGSERRDALAQGTQKVHGKLKASPTLSTDLTSVYRIAP